MVSPRVRPVLLFSASLLVALFISSCTGGGGHHGGGPAPAFTITKTHTGNLTQGQMGATYTVTVTNSGNAATAGNVEVADTVPAGETLVSLTGTGWTCPGTGGANTCDRADALGAGSSYPTITVTVNVAASASSPQINMVSVMGGGAAVAANASDSTTINVPVLSITKTHTGNFTQGQMGATYTVTVSNTGAAATNGTTVEVTDTVPAGETLVSMTGTGWTCPGTGGANTCDRANALAAGSSYPTITVTVNVAASASSPQVNMVSVSGGGSASANAMDSTTINAPVLSITTTHSGNFAQGQMGATYTVTVSNTGTAATNGTTVEVTDTVPAGETLVSMTGTGWTCPGTGGANTCDRANALAAGSSYPMITVTVNVAANASSPQVEKASVSGGGSASANAMDSTTIITALLSIAKTHTGNFNQGQVGATYTVTVSNSNAAGTGPTNGTPVTVTEMPPAGLTVTGMAGTGWVCVVAATDTCTRSDVLAAGASYSTITVMVTVGVSATSPQVNRVSVSGGGSPTANGMDSTTILAPSLSIAKTHTGNFNQGQMGATYTVTVSNAAGANIGPTNGTTVTVTDTVPSGETLVSMTGTGWTCVAASCTRTDMLAAGASYPAITVTVNVAANAATPQVNQVSVSGGGSATANAMDSTTIVEPVLTITKTHTGNFTQGQMGATYTVTVSNTGAAATNGTTVEVTDTVPAGETLVSMTGTGWTCPGTGGANTCDRANALAAGSSYPAITVTVNVAANAASSVTNMVTVSGGGSATANGSDMTTINASGPPTCPLPVLGNESLLSGTYSGLVNAWNDPLKNGGGPVQAAFAFTATGSTGAASTNITNGEVDSNHVNADGTAQVASKHQTFTAGCFNLGADLRGLMIWNFSAASGGGSATFAIAVRADGTLGELILFSDANPSTVGGNRGAGHFEKSVGAITATNGSLAFGITAYSPNGGNNAIHRAAFIGVLGNVVFGSATAANGFADLAISEGGTGIQANADNGPFTATFSVPDALGRGTAILNFPNVPGICGTPPCPLTLNYAYYIGGTEGGTLHIKLQSTDIPDNKGHALSNGESIVQTVPTGGFGAGSLNGNAVFQMSGNGLVSPTFTDVAAGLIIGNGTGGTQTYLDEVISGSQTSVGTTTIPGGTFAASANGMGSVTFGASRAFSVAMIAPNAGFILEGTQANSPGSNGHILIGDFGPQTVPTGGFTNTQFSGLYIFATDHPSDPSVDDIIGSATANPAAVPSPTFSGKVDESNTSGLKTDETLAATYAVDARGRNMVTLTSPGGSNSIAWLRDTNNAEIISDTADTNAAILRAHGGGAAVGAAGGNASIFAPPSGAATLVESGVAGARTTLTLAANVPAASDNGAGVNWFVDSIDSVTCTSPNAVQGGTGASGNGTITMNTANGASATYTPPTSASGVGNFVLVCAQQPGTGGMAAGAFSAAVLVIIASSNNAIPTTSASILATGVINSSPVPFVMRIRGFNTSTGLSFAMIGRFALDGIGSATSADGTGITNGLLDVNIAHADGSSSSFVKVPFTGGYHMDDSNHGTAKFTITGGAPWAGILDALPSPTLSFSFELDLIGAFADPIETDASFTSTGQFQPQDPVSTDFSTGVITGPYAFSLNGPAGTGANGVQKGIVGRLDLSTGTISNTSTSDDQGGNAQSLSGTYAIDDATNGHGAFNVSVGGVAGPVVSFYVGPSANVLFALETDQNGLNSGRGILVGSVHFINDVSFDNTSLGGPNSFAEQGMTPSTAVNGKGHASVAIGVFTGTPTTAGNGTLSGVTVFNDGGTVAGPLAFNGSGSSTYTIDARGRGFALVSLTIGGTTVTYKFVFYLISSAADPFGAFGFLQEQPASDGSNRGRNSVFAATGVAPPVTASSVGDNTVWVAGMEIATAVGANAVDALTLNGGADNAGTYQNALNTMSGNFTVTDQTNGLGTLAPAGGTKFFGNATAAFVFEPFSAEIEVIGTDATNHEPQIIFLDQ